MKAAEILLRYMDRLHDFFEILDSYLDMGMDFFSKLKVWFEKILNYMEQAINALADTIGIKKGDSRHSEEHLFV